MELCRALSNPNALKETHLGADFAVLFAFESRFFNAFDLFRLIVLCSSPEFYIGLVLIFVVLYLSKDSLELVVVDLVDLAGLSHPVDLHLD